MLTRRAILDEAHLWRGTRYHPLASVRGVGCDCTGLVTGVYKAVCGGAWPTAPLPERYAALLSPSWWLRTPAELFYELLCEVPVLQEVSGLDALPGDMLVFALRGGTPMSHPALLTRPFPSARMLHAVQGQRVRESRLSPLWAQRWRATFRLSGVED